MTRSDLAIIGAGMTRFAKFPDRSLKSLGREAIKAAIKDAGIEPGEIDMAFVGNSMSGTITGQTAVVGQTILRDMGFAGIPVFNIDNACASSSSAFNLAVQAIRAGAAETVLVVGVEKLVVTEDKTRAYAALNGAADPEFVAASGIDVGRQSVFVAAVYPERLKNYADRYGLEAETLAKIAVKNRQNAGLNPVAQFTDPITVADVLASRQIVGPVTMLMCAPIGDGASVVIVTRADKIRKDQRPVKVLASAIGMGVSPGGETSIGMTAKRAYAQAGIGPQDIDVAEMHDSISFNELLAYEEVGFCAPGQGRSLVDEGATALGGRIPVNPSGGLESRGHPVAATGLAQLIELTTQLRAEAGARQVNGARIALAENAGGFAKDDTAAIAITILGV
ncbi:thiolase family protein [Actibacterium sp. D379-3]